MYLENGIVLNDEFMVNDNDEDTPCKVSMADANKVFKRNSRERKVFCATHNLSWTVKRINGSLWIGCKRFSPEMINIVRKWAGVE